MTDEVYHNLAKVLDTLPNGFPFPALPFPFPLFPMGSLLSSSRFLLSGVLPIFLNFSVSSFGD
jgi:hypothetical protein